MSQHHSDNKAFELNHFEDLADTPQNRESEQEPTADFDLDDRHEPLIRDEQDSAPPLDDSPDQQDIQHIAAPVNPQMGSDFPSKADGNNRSGASLATAFAIVAMLIAAGSVWLNFNQPEPENRLAKIEQPATDYNTIINDEIRKLRERLTVIELEKGELGRKITQQDKNMQQQKQRFTSQISNLKAEIAALSDKLARQAKQQIQVKPVIKQPTVKKSVSKPEPAPVKKIVSKTNTPYELPAPLESLPPGSTRETTATTSKQVGWVVNLVSVYSESAANKELERLQNKGINAEVAESTVNGRQLYRIRVAGFSSRKEAIEQKNLLTGKYGIKDAWIHKP